MASQSFDQGSVRTRGGKTTTSEERGGEASSTSGIRRDQNRQSPNQSGETISSQVQGLLDQQVVKGAKVVSNVANSARRAADELETDTPQLAGLVRGMADRLQDYSRTLENQSVTDIYQTASDFTRRQPEVVFGVAALAGFFALRTFKSSSSEAGNAIGTQRTNNMIGEEFHGS
jgi:ElaB/YqjD/DUF883 family membrane-anchored ribosome-binding protein